MYLFIYLFLNKENFSKIQAWVFLQISLNSDQYLDPNIFFF
jgi:hypothetical protein